MPLTPKSTRELLAQLGHEPKRFLGQNFLVDGNIVRKSLELGGVAPGDTVVEIGPGLGTLTNALLEAGAEVWAIERDYNLHKHLAATLAATNPRLHLMEGDAVEHPLAGLDPLERGRPRPRDVGGEVAAPPSARPFKIVANLPYAIATPWLDGVLSGPLPDRMVLMLQQEAAQRYVARPGSKTFGAISIFLQAAYAVAPGHKVDGSCFYPQPDIESYLLHLTRLPAPFTFPAATKAVIRACFQQRRKQIGGLLRGKLPDGGAAWLAKLAAAGLSAATRPEQIPVAQWRELTV
ncbi:16S rRNA (adenine(1518)-N(6)/adenine(1519)-N(6))-dimethyltransferase RsmA [Opitutus sp. GAS368]|uniref:16S rRNA (adenine(1518)-N(6)/adenine(1519)-N(6))- dimethyltransferase RsmA n=1 Tax=Opitutus sp. GAS368 TaxID=1882749 RepID=UPI00087A532E|nr:16S rRNA (adenine(1518)-N(6)/adenine(1519)-N(6))-dimethyltransferase RsmA [Opitutus sp. GAS368]SDS58637.1 16S rRNA (adenine1518-N6/adenine1519-N6)-dimethyltransferase [Opitutus sp. GAS368]